MTVHKCPDCGEIILIAMDAEDEKDLSNKQANHQRKHDELEAML